MRNSSLLFASLLFLLAGCSLFKSKPPPAAPRPLHLGATATLDITNGIDVIGSTALPSGFIPSAEVPPMWLAEGFGVAVAGSLNGKATVLGLGGAGFNRLANIASDFGPGAPAGNIVSVAASPDGMEVATAVAEPANKRLNVMLIDSISGGDGHSVASFDGAYRVASMNWIDRDTLAIVLRESLAPAQPPTNIETVSSSGGLYLIGISGLGSLTHLDAIPCRLAHLSFSPNRRFAASSGDSDAAPAIVDLQNQKCQEIRSAAPIRILGWAPDSSDFLYAARGGGGAVGTFRFSLATARSTVVAVSSPAVAYASDGTIIAMGNAGLTWRRVTEDPDAPAKTEIALIDPRTAQITLNTLGFSASPTVLAQSTMVFTDVSDSAAIDSLVLLPNGLTRLLLDYSYPSRSAFVLASGPVRGQLSMSWAPDGRALALVDGDASLSMLTVMVPPR
jgi:hypothetical protein